MRHERIEIILERAGFGDFEYGYSFNEDRKWRFAFAWPAKKVAIDILERGDRITPERIVEAQLDGWIVLPVPEKMVGTPRMLSWIERAIGRKGNC